MPLATSPHTNGNVLPIHHSVQTLCVEISISMYRRRSTSVMTRWKLKFFGGCKDCALIYSKRESNIGAYNHWLFGHYPSSCFYLKQHIGNWTLPLSSGKRPTHLGSVDRASPYLRMIGGFLPEESRRVHFSKVVLNKTGRWIISENSVIILIYHRDEVLYLVWFILETDVRNGQAPSSRKEGLSVMFCCSGHYVEVINKLWEDTCKDSLRIFFLWDERPSFTRIKTTGVIIVLYLYFSIINWLIFL
jgi:hypothetical protein